MTWDYARQRFRGSFLFNGTGNGIWIPAIPSLNATVPMTLSAWVYTFNVTTQMQCAVRHTGGHCTLLMNWHSSDPEPYDYSYPGELSFLPLSLNGAEPLLHNGTTLTANRWYHVVCRRTGPERLGFLPGRHVAGRQVGGHAGGQCLPSDWGRHRGGRRNRL